MKYLRFLGIPLFISGLYGAAWAIYTPRTWHAPADFTLCVIAAVAGALLVVAPTDGPWEEE